MTTAILIRVRFARKYRKKRGFLEKIEAQNLQNFVHASLELVFLLDNGHQHIDADGDPHLRLDRVGRSPKKCLDP